MKKKTNLKIKYKYAITPLVFCVVATILFLLAISPFIPIASTVISAAISKGQPNFSEELKTIYKLSHFGNDVETINQSEVIIPEFGTHYANLKIVQVGVDADLYFGDSETILKKGIGQYAGSFLPGYNKPILLSAHNNLAFNALKNIQLSQMIEITTNYGKYQYKVTDFVVKKSTDPTAFDLGQDKEQLILYTCFPFDELGVTDERFFVYADKISGPTII